MRNDTAFPMEVRGSFCQRRIFDDADRRTDNHTTSSGAALPLVASPQGELLTVNEKNISLITDSLIEVVHVKPLRLDLEAGCWVVLATISPGAKLPIHYHYRPCPAAPACRMFHTAPNITSLQGCSTPPSGRVPPAV